MKKYKVILSHTIPPIVVDADAIQILEDGQIAFYIQNEYVAVAPNTAFVNLIIE